MKRVNQNDLGHCARKKTLIIYFFPSNPQKDVEELIHENECSQASFGRNKFYFLENLSNTGAMLGRRSFYVEPPL